jgi:hypothetical protein
MNAKGGPGPEPKPGGGKRPPRPPRRTAVGFVLDGGGGPKRETVRINLPPRAAGSRIVKLPGDPPPGK